MALPTPTTDSGFEVLAKMPTTAEALKWALAFLGAMRHLVVKPAIVLDIDGTILKNYDEPEDGSGGRPVAKCIVGFKSFAEACANGGIAIFVVTARPDFKENREWSVRQLDNCGIEPVVKTYMRPEGQDSGSFKLESRNDIRRSGYTVLLSIGDQFLDLSRKQPKPGEIDDHAVWVGTLGDNGAYAIKLPSEFPQEKKT